MPIIKNFKFSNKKLRQLTITVEDKPNLLRVIVKRTKRKIACGSSDRKMMFLHKMNYICPEYTHIAERK